MLICESMTSKSCGRAILILKYAGYNFSKLIIFPDGFRGWIANGGAVLKQNEGKNLKIINIDFAY